MGGREGEQGSRCIGRGGRGAKISRMSVNDRSLGRLTSGPSPQRSICSWRILHQPLGFVVSVPDSDIHAQVFCICPCR